MKPLMFGLLIFISVKAGAEDKRDIWFLSCRAHYQMAHLLFWRTGHPDDYIPREKYQKIMANAKMLCQDGRDRWDHEKKWDGMTDPDKLGCINAMQLIYNPDEPAVTRNAKISKLQDIVCKSVRSK